MYTNVSYPNFEEFPLTFKINTKQAYLQRRIYFSIILKFQFERFSIIGWKMSESIFSELYIQ